MKRYLLSLQKYFEMMQFCQRVLFYATILAILGALSSCREDDDCRSTGESMVVFEVKNIDLLAITQLSNGDSVYIGSVDTLRQFWLSLNTDTMAYKMTFAAGKYDTMLIFYHQLEPEFLGLNCGFAPRFYIDSLFHTIHNIKSIVIKNPEVSTDVYKKNLSIFN